MKRSIIGASKTLAVNGTYINIYYGVDIDTRVYFVTWALTVDKPYADIYTQDFKRKSDCETFYNNLVSTFLSLM